MNLIQKYGKELELIKNCNLVDSILIFGSYLENKQNSNSDLDIAIIFKKNVSNNKKQEILSYGNEELDLNNFENLPLYLQFKIINFGTVYFTNKNLYELKRSIRHEWFDFKPTLNRIYKSKKLLPIM